MKLVKFAAAAALALSSVSAMAAGNVTVGATVFGPKGEPVGTVTSIANGVVTVDTGKHKAPLPAAAIGSNDKGLSITVTKDQIDGMIEQQIAAANAKRDAALVAGAAVSTAKGMPLGSISEVNGDDVIVETTDGPVAMKREHFAVNQAGTLIALFTMDQIKAAAAAAKASAQPEATSTDAAASAS